jgi:hypothetical protein
MSIFNRSLFRLIATKEVLKYFRLFPKSSFSSRIKFWCPFIKPLLRSLVTSSLILFSLNVYFPFYSQKHYYLITNVVKVQKVDKVVVLYFIAPQGDFVEGVLLPRDRNRTGAGRAVFRLFLAEPSTRLAEGLFDYSLSTKYIRSIYFLNLIL